MIDLNERVAHRRVPPEAVISHCPRFAYSLHINSYNYKEGCR